MMPDRPTLLSFSCPDTAGVAQVWWHRLAPLEGVIYVYATFPMGPANPIPFGDRGPVWIPAAGDRGPGSAIEPTGQVEGPGGFVVQERRAPPAESPQFLQTVALGRTTGDQFL
ncbi:MAG: hypothetical protein HYW07_11500, partial [Candidatus Latescibacteria bacterium]|nr:hypothetical protein [Candidatus Latescibacterota bacterium]